MKVTTLLMSKQSLSPSTTWGTGLTRSLSKVLHTPPFENHGPGHKWVRASRRKGQVEKGSGTGCLGVPVSLPFAISLHRYPRPVPALPSPTEAWAQVWWESSPFPQQLSVTMLAHQDTV